jgi:hypothetical protein
MPRFESGAQASPEVTGTTHGFCCGKYWRRRAHHETRIAARAQILAEKPRVAQKVATTVKAFDDLMSDMALT